MVNFAALNNLTPLNLTVVESINNEDIVPVLIQNSNTVSEGYLGLGVMVVIFIALVYMLYKQDGDIRLDITRAIMMSSGIVSIFGTVMLISGFFTSLQHVLWFVYLFIVTYILVLQLKKRNL